MRASDASDPGNARALVQKHGHRDLWLNPPPLPLSTEEMDYVFDQPFARAPHPSYGEAKIPAWEMIRFSVNIMRGCFGGCTFCSITEHEGRIIQNRSEESILKEVEAIRDQVPGFTVQCTGAGAPLPDCTDADDTQTVTGWIATDPDLSDSTRSVDGRTVEAGITIVDPWQVQRPRGRPGEAVETYRTIITRRSEGLL